MADTEHLADQVVTAKLGDGKPDRARTLALAAADEGFQDHIKVAAQVLFIAIDSGQFSGATERATTAYTAAMQTRAVMRNIINTTPTDPKGE
jgi:hypothetical protein